MENWAKPRTRHTDVHGPLHGPVNAQDGGTGKSAVDGRHGRNVTRAMENWAKPRTRHTDVHGPLHGPVNGLYVDTGKNGRRPSWTKRDARHGKLGKTTYEAHERTRALTRTLERAVRGHVKKTAEARRGRNVTRAMENWAKPRTRHTDVLRTLPGPLNGLYIDT